jgi:TIR domain-containing protein
MAKILISYRRSDSAGMTGRIFDRLILKYGASSVFMDVDNIPFGIDFRTHVRDELLQSDVMLVVIGQRWLGRGEGAETRMSDKDDPVRVEVESALNANIPVIPLLVEGAQMPKASELPESLRELVYRNAAIIDSGRDFHAHVERLSRSIDQIIEQKNKAAAETARLAAEAKARQPSPPAQPPVAPVAPKPAAAGPPRQNPPAAESPRANAPPALKVAMDQSGGAALAVPGTTSFHALMRSPRDFWGGVGLIVLALFAVWACSDLPGMRGFAFGPGTAPRIFAYCLLGLGVAILLVGLLAHGEPTERFAFSGPAGAALLLLVLIPLNIFSARISRTLPAVSADVVFAAVSATVVLALAIGLMRWVPRGPLFITAATIVFGVTVRPLGLVFSSFVSMLISAYATEEIRWIEAIICAAVLTVFCSLLFPWGLNLPLQLWPRF